MATSGADRQRQYRARQRAKGKRDLTIAVTHDQETVIRQYLDGGSLPVTSDDNEQEPFSWLKDLSVQTKWTIVEVRIMVDMLCFMLPEEQAYRVLDDVVLALRKATGSEHTIRINTLSDVYGRHQ